MWALFSSAFAFVFDRAKCIRLVIIGCHQLVLFGVIAGDTIYCYVNKELKSCFT